MMIIKKNGMIMRVVLQHILKINYRKSVEVTEIKKNLIWSITWVQYKVRINKCFW